MFLPFFSGQGGGEEVWIGRNKYLFHVNRKIFYSHNKIEDTSGFQNFYIIELWLCSCEL